jgi:TIR domain
MAHDVFISHAYKDKSIADAICEKLESAGLRCWIAPRDISVGEDWTKAIRNAIESARALVLVFSDNSNGAPHVEREIANAFYTGRRIIPFRLTTALPRREFLFYLSDARWYDAVSQPAEQHLEILAQGVSSLLVDHALSGNKGHQLQGAPTKAATLNSVNAWNGESAISRYRLPRMVKYAAIAVPVCGVAWLLWLAAQQTNYDSLQEESGSQSGHHGTTTSPGRGVGNASDSAPHYTYTRLGLWVAASPTPAASIQPAAQNTPSSTPAGKSVTANDLSPSSSAPAGGSANANDLPPSNVDQDTGTGVNEQTPVVYDPTGGQSKPDRSARLTNHHRHQRVRSRAKSHRPRLVVSWKWMAQ